MYNNIYSFCKVRNEGNIFKNGDLPPPRVNFLIHLIQKVHIDFQVDRFQTASGFGYNIIMRGSSDRMVVAHHDILNPLIDNANDNSASCINAIMIKKLMPAVNVILLDGEECGGLGSQRVSEQINAGLFGTIDWILNLELTGRGGKNFFIGNYSGKLQTHIKSIFDCPVIDTPFNDSVIFRRNGIDSCVINPLPPLVGGTSGVRLKDGRYLDHSMLMNCHSQRDTLSTISTSDMKEFVEEVVIKILA